MNNSILTEMQSHKWAMEPTALKSFVEKIVQLSSTSSIISSVSIEIPKKMLKVINNTAHINISGVLLKSVPGWVKLWGLNATGYDEIIEQIDEAMKESSVTSIQLNVASPGGVVSGVEAAADAIYNANKIKPFNAVVEDLAASAAYWLTSQANSISANKTAEIGSIGVYSVYYDWSGWDEKAGIKTVVIRSGEHKGMGIDKITDTQIEAVQQVIDGLASQFVSAIARGRNKDSKQISGYATGRLWLAEDAKKKGLIDNVSSNNVSGQFDGNESAQVPDDDINNLNNGENIMDEKELETKISEAESQAKKTAANEEKQRLSELKAAFPSDLEFAIEQFEAGATVTEAKAAFSDVLQKRLEKKENEDEEPLSNINQGGLSGGNFVEEGKKRAKENKIPLGQAYKELAKEEPELYANYRKSLGLTN